MTRRRNNVEQHSGHTGRLWFSLGVVLLSLTMVCLTGCQRSTTADIVPEEEVVSSPYLDLALEAETWIASARRKTEHGIEWLDLPDDADSADHTLYHGSPGVILFYLELAESTGERRFLDEAIAGADELIHTLESEPAESVSFYAGIGGAVFSLNQVYSATSERRFQTAAAATLERVRQAAIERGAGLAWDEPMPFSEIHGKTGMKEVLDMTHGAAGTGLLFLYAAQVSIHPEALHWAKQVGNRLLEHATPVEGGVEWEMVTDIPIDFKAPGFSHGTAGIAYFLARLFEETGDQRYLDSALAGAGRLKEIATVNTDTGERLVYHHEGDGEDLYYLGWCHGPVGTGRLFHQLFKVTGDESWQEWMVGGIEGAMGTGAPEERSPGFWNNTSQCCGDAGLGEYGLSVYEVTSNERYLELAKLVATGLEAKGQAAASGICWVQAEHRSRPDFLKAHTGYMQGAAGIGSFFLRLDGVIKGESHKIHLPDSPFA